MKKLPELDIFEKTHSAHINESLVLVAKIIKII